MKILATLFLIPSLLWGQQMSLSGKYSLSGQHSSSRFASPIFQWMSTETDLSKFSGSSGSDVIADPTSLRGGNVVRVTYGPAAAGTTQISINRSVDRTISGTRRVLVRWFVYFPLPETDGYRTAQRKVIYFNPGLGFTTEAVSGWTFLPDYYQQYMTNAVGWSGVGESGHDIPWQTWHCIEQESYLGSAPYAMDGYENFWFDGVKDATMSDSGIANTAWNTTGQLWQLVTWGRQVETHNSTTGYPLGIIPVTAISRTGGVTTATTSYNHLNADLVGKDIIVTGVPNGGGGTDFNGIFTVTAQTADTAQYSQALADDSATPNGSSQFVFQAHEDRYFQDMEIYNLDNLAPGTPDNVPHVAGCK